VRLIHNAYAAPATVSALLI